MKASSLKYAVLRAVATIVMVILVVIPFHAFLSIWLSSGIGHYTLVRLWKEFLLVICIGGLGYLIASDVVIRTHTLSRKLVQLVIIYMAVQLLWGAISYHQHSVSAKALAYGLLIDLRFLIVFLVTWSTALRYGKLRSYGLRLLLWPATVVIAFGLLQVFILPRDFLSHFGYGPKTIAPFETINSNRQYVRIMSTLRGANPLGAYLLIPLSAAALYCARPGPKRTIKHGLILLGGLICLIGSFSRGAWLGAAVSLFIITALNLKGRPRQLLYGIAALLLLGGAVLGMSLRHNLRFQNIVFHTQQHSAVKTNSDGGHSSAFRAGIRDLVHEPLGRGPGTAGPASVYNGRHPARIAENYFLQIGQETGWLGLILFLLINIGVGYLLFLRRHDPLALILFASLIGLSLVNMLSHAWADDTLAYVWWGLAGIAMSYFPDKAMEPER